MLWKRSELGKDYTGEAGKYPESAWAHTDPVHWFQQPGHGGDLLKANGALKEQLQFRGWFSNATARLLQRFFGDLLGTLSGSMAVAFVNSSDPETSPSADEGYRVLV